jgi:hypothetical protein
VHTLTVTELPLGPTAAHDVPEGQACDESQYCRHSLLKHTSFSPHCVAPCTSEHDCPAMPVPAVMQA